MRATRTLEAMATPATRVLAGCSRRPATVARWVLPIQPERQQHAVRSLASLAPGRPARGIAVCTRSLPPTSLAITPVSDLRRRIRASARWASNGARGGAKEEPSAAVAKTASPPIDEGEVAESGAKEKVKMGEVRRLLQLAKPERRTIGIAIGLLCISSGVSLSIPLGIGRIIDIFSGQASNLPVSIPTAAGLLAVFFAAGAAANMGRTILMRISGQRIVARLREAAYSNVLRQDIGWHDLQGAATKSTTTEISGASHEHESKEPTPPSSTAIANVKDTGVRSTGDIISRLGSDAGIVGESLTRELSEGLRAVVTATVGIGAMLYISSKVTGVMLLIVPPISVAAVFYGRFLKKLSRRTQKAVGEMVAVSEERLGAIRTVQAFNAVEPAETRRFSEKVNKVFELAKTEAWASGLFFGGTGFAGNCTLIALLTYGGSLVAHGELTVGQLISLLTYTVYVGSSLVGLTSFFGTIMKGLGASSRIFELLDARPLSVKLGVGRPLPVTTPPRRLVFDNVHFAYPSRPHSEILRGVNLTIEPGTITSIAGGSGSGKSTIANLLERFYDPSSGRILYGDDNIRDFTPESWRQRIAIVPQDPALFSATIAENIAYGRPDASRAEIEEAARLANCGFIDTLPRGFDTQVGARGAQLSGGQRQRLAIARALLQKPKILVADEATSALDAASESLVNEAISNISQSHQLTTILIAHRLSTLKTADKVVYMEDGVVAEQGSYDELAREGTRFNHLIRSQLLGGPTPTTTKAPAEERKSSPASRSLSSRLTPLAASSPQPSTLTFVKPSASAPTTASLPISRSQTPVSDMPAQKRSLDDAAGPSTPAALSKSKKRRARRSGEYVGGKFAQRAKKESGAANAGDDGDLEEGEVVEGNFDDLFMVDTTPAAVKEKDRFVGAPTPLRGNNDGSEELEEPNVLLPSEAKVTSGAGSEASEPTRAFVDDGMESDEAMRIFAKEVAMSEDEDEEETSGDDDESVAGEGLMLYDNEEELEKAIQGRIVDDSSAPVTGRYYKEADLTKTCVLCGESGHSSRDCTHSQCFICGAIDTDHEARNCPVALVCSACGLYNCSPLPRRIWPAMQHVLKLESHRDELPIPLAYLRHVWSEAPEAQAAAGLRQLLLPRGHPLRYADPSAFNRAALGSAASSVPGPSASSSSSSRRRGGATGKLERRPQPRQYDDDDAADDDWFASRARGGGGRSGGGGSGNGGGRASQNQPPPPPPPPNSFRDRGRSGGGSARGSHIHFSDDSRSRFHDSGTPSSSYRDRDRDYGSAYESPRDEWRSMYGSAGGGNGGARGDGRRGPGGGKGNNGGGEQRGAPPSLLDRMGGGGGGRPSKPQPRYKGGYTSTASLQVPGQSTAIPGSSPKHQLRQRSPQGKRGKPRRNSAPQPPRRLKERLRDLREQVWFLPAVLLGVASAIRISSHSSDYSTFPTPRRPSSRHTAVKPPSPPTAKVVPEPLVRAGNGNAKAHDVLDEAVRHALEDAWKLPPHVAKQSDGDASRAGEAVNSGGADAAQGGSDKQRTLAELYADLEELGVSAHELQEALDEAMRDMRLTRLVPALASVLAATAAAAAGAGDAAPQATFLSPEQLATAGGESYTYQSDIARLMRVVVSHLYHDRDVFVRELLSNANDALEKVRLIALTDPSILEPAEQLNVTVLADKDSGRIVIRDSGVGMSKEQLAANLGTIARSGTSEFLENLEKGDGGNLIGQFGLGFYSSFLVADRVTVASKTADDTEQWVFESEANADGFKIVKDPRGPTLGRGTEITLYLKPDAADEYLDLPKLRYLIQKHAEYNAAPIYLWSSASLDPSVNAVPVVEAEDDEIKVEDEATAVEQPQWDLVNDRPPLWMRDSKDVTEEEYENFYMKTFDSPDAPLAWAHFKGDAGTTSFRALVYIPSALPNDFYSKDYISLNSLKLFVKRVFITSDLGPNYLERHMNWIKVFIDVDDLPLNVGRDSLQKTKALAQIKKNLQKRVYDLFAQIASQDPSKYAELYEKAGVALKVGAVEDAKNRDRIVKLLRFTTSAQENSTSLDEVVARRKQGQTQIYYIAGAGQKKDSLEKSPFVERILARGYEVLYFTDPIDEMVINSVPTYGGLRFQDVAKDGVKFGDEDDDEKKEEEDLKSTFAPLVGYLKKELAEFVDKVTISTRLTTSPCLVTAGTYGYSGNMERLLAAQNQGSDNFMLNFARMQKKNFELNPKHPLIERLLEKVDEAGDDEDALAELKESVQTALLKSSYQVPDPNSYFSLVESMLRKSLGVSQTAQAEVDVKPAPPVETGPPPSEPPPPPSFDEDFLAKDEALRHEQEEAEEAFEKASEHKWVDWSSVKEKIGEGIKDTVKAAVPDLDTDVPNAPRVIRASAAANVPRCDRLLAQRRLFSGFDTLPETPQSDSVLSLLPSSRSRLVSTDTIPALPLAMTSITLYYDVVSPWTLFAYQVLKRYRQPWDFQLVLKPMFLGGVMQASGNKPYVPVLLALRDGILGSPRCLSSNRPITVKNKGIWMNQHDLPLQAAFTQTPYKFPETFPLNTIHCMRTLRAIADVAPDKLEKATDLFFGAIWNPPAGTRAEEAIKPSAFPKLLGTNGLFSGDEIENIMELSTSDDIKNKLKTESGQLVEEGAFGFPWMVAKRSDGQTRPFFGSDRFEHMAFWLGKEWKGPLPDGRKPAAGLPKL
ncbi:ATP-dependent permease MDL1, mitochondrial [Rhodotorula toruloides]|nr:ATP-dependent permease MDL1, mitochondrial [Rhodotorula toruloides]